jgi:hypothetical protein
MKSVHDIVTIAKKTESIFLSNLTTQPSPLVNVPTVCENPKDNESNTSKDTNMYITVDNELVETSSKRQKNIKFINTTN